MERRRTIAAARISRGAGRPARPPSRFDAPCQRPSALWRATACDGRFRLSTLIPAFLPLESSRHPAYNRGSWRLFRAPRAAFPKATRVDRPARCRSLPAVTQKTSCPLSASGRGVTIVTLESQISEALSNALGLYLRAYYIQGCGHFTLEPHGFSMVTLPRGERGLKLC